jgi:hypothetical protein
MLTRFSIATNGTGFGGEKGVNELTYGVLAQ